MAPNWHPTASSALRENEERQSRRSPHRGSRLLLHRRRLVDNAVLPGDASNGWFAVREQSALLFADASLRNLAGTRIAS